MRSLVVLGGALLVGGSSIVGLSQMENVKPRVAGFMAMITGEETNKNVRRPVWSFRHARPGNETPSVDQPVRLATAAQPGFVSPAVAPRNKPVNDLKARELVAALGGRKTASANPWWLDQTTSKTAQDAGVKARSGDVETADVKLLETIRKKAVLAAKNDMPQVKKNIAYEKADSSRSFTISGGAATPGAGAGFKAPLTAAVERPKPAKQLKKMAMLSSKERRELGQLVEDKKLPAIDLVIEFAYKSAKLSDRSLPVLARIGAALTDGKLADATFVIAGHTDSIGSNGYNMDLSSQRANSVRNYLRRVHKIDDKRLLAVGYGEDRLKNQRDSEAAENRRVEFINLIR